MTAPDDLIRRDTAERAIRALIDSPARGSDLHARGVVCGLVIAQESLAALPADPVAEAAGKLVASIGVPLVSRDYDTVCSVCHWVRNDLKENWARKVFVHAPDCAWETLRAAVAARAKETR